jgi:site-specific DNA-methyltransferase (adenine-specific)
MIKLLQGDCLKLLQDIDDNSIDAIITDPPYGTTACKWDVIIPFDEMWSELNRVIKPKCAIVLFGSQPFTSALVMSNPDNFKYEWIWEKSKASNFLNAKRMPLKAHENILVFGKLSVKYYPQKVEGKPFNRGMRKNNNGIVTEVYNKVPNASKEIINVSGLRNPRTVQYFKTAEAEGKFHPTQKPVALLEYLIKTYTLEGETVLDFTMGSGSTGVACVNTNRNFIGMELEKKYFDIATSRINDSSLNKDIKSNDVSPLFDF